jgi:hypothetical protein
LVQQPLPEASRSSVYRLLRRNGVSHLAKKEEQETGQDDKHGQFKDYGPGFVHIDCFYLPKLEGQKRYCFGTNVKAEHDFDQFCQEQQIEHRTTLPYTPKTNGMALGRMNGLTKENTTKKNRYVTVPEMLDDLHGWFVRYNFCRKNRRIGDKTPYEAVLAWYQKDPSIFVIEPTALLAFRSQSGDT